MNRILGPKRRATARRNSAQQPRIYRTGFSPGGTRRASSVSVRMRTMRYSLAARAIASAYARRRRGPQRLHLHVLHRIATTRVESFCASKRARERSPQTAIAAELIQLISKDCQVKAGRADARPAPHLHGRLEPLGAIPEAGPIQVREVIQGIQICPPVVRRRRAIWAV